MPKEVDLFVLCMLIYMFETKIRGLIARPEFLAKLSEEQVSTLVDKTICSEKILSSTFALIQIITRDPSSDGLPSILNKIQQCKGDFVSEEQHLVLDLDTVLSSCIDLSYESQGVQNSGKVGTKRSAVGQKNSSRNTLS